MTLALLGLALLAGLPASPPSSPAPDARRAYQEQRAQAGRTPDDQVRLALWCEVHGLPAERLRHLALAVLRDPTHATARGLMGLVAYQGKWQPPDAVAEKIKADRKLADALAAYNGRRERMPDTADAHWQLALWCEQNSLHAEATAHLTSVVRLDPSRDVAWKRLGYTRREGHWVTDAQLAAVKADLDAQKQADRTWTPLLEKWKGMLSRDDTRADAEAGLLDIAAPYAVGPIVRVFGTSIKPDDQARAVQLLGQIDTPTSSQALAILAFRSRDADVRRAAREVLAHRDPREYVGLLLARLDRIGRMTRYQFGTTRNENGKLHPSLLIEGRKKNVRIDSNLLVDHDKWPVPGRLYADSVPFGGLPPGMSWDPAWGNAGVDPSMMYGPWSLPSNLAQDGNSAVGEFLAGHLPAGTKVPNLSGAPNAAGAMVAYYTRMAMIRDAQIAQVMYRNANTPSTLGPRFELFVSSTMAELDAKNVRAEQNGSAIYETLRQTTRQDLPDDPEAWKAWYVDALGYSYRSPGQPGSEQAQPKPTFSFTIVSCFAAGTTVRTLTGDRPIETLRVGDRLLAQDTATGALAYRPITRVHHNPPSEVLRVRLGGETILATGFHRFWKAGHGWAMARELKAGDVLRTLGGLASVESVEADRVQPVFNLDVAEDADFFVGKAGALVHDNTLPDPRALPFDAPRPVAVARRGE